MNCKDYTKKDLEGKKYAILSCDAEEYFDYIVSLHEEYNKAKKRLEYLRKIAKRDFDKGISITDYILIKIDDERVLRCGNYEREED